MASYEQGRYVATLKSVVLSASKTKQTPQVVIQFTPVGKVNPQDPENLLPCANFDRSIFRAITSETIEYVVQDLRQLGYPHDDFDHLDEDSPNRHDFGSPEIVVSCKHEEYQGKTQERWSLAGEGYKPKALEKTEVKKLNALFGKSFKSAKATTAPVQRQAEAKQSVAAAASTAAQAEEVF